MKKALLVGINNYPGTSNDLQGCINDVNDAKASLATKGFTCTTLTNSNATRANIISKLTSLVTAAKSGDSLVFYYSAHGSQVTDSSGDESDGWDEVLCPCDWPNYVSDDDFRTILAKAKSGVSIDIIFDCCHSGTGTRDIGLPYTVRSLPPIAGEVAHRGKKSKAISLVPGLNHVLWAGCKDGQTSAELSIGGAIRGAFSYYLWRDIRVGGTRSQIMADVCKRVAALGLSQVPQLEATKTETLEAAFT